MFFHFFRACLILCFAVLYVSHLGAQTDTLLHYDQSRFITDEDGVYNYKGEVYEYEDLASIFKRESKAMEYYDWSYHKERLINQSTNLMIGSGLSAIVLFVLANKQVKRSQGYYKFGNIGIVSLGVTVLVIPFNITQNILKGNYRKKSIQAFNEQEIIENGYKNDSSYLGVGVSENGVGLVYNF